MKNKMELKTLALKSILWEGSGKVVRQTYSWIIMILLARLLNPSVFGIMAMASMIIALGELINDAGFGVAVVQKEKLDEYDLSTSFFCSLFIGFSIFLIIYLTTPAISSYFNKPQLNDILKFLSILFILGALRVVHLSLLKRELKFGIIVKCSIRSEFISGIISLLLAYLGYGVWSLVYGAFIREALFTIQIIINSHWKPKFVFSFDRLHGLVKFSLPVTGNRILWYFNQHFDILIIGKFLGDNILGIYRIAFVLGRAPLKKIWAMVSRVMLPIFSKLQTDNVRIRKYYFASVKYLALIIVPSSIGLFIMAEEFVLLFLKEKWLPILIPLRVFLMLTIIECLVLSVAPVLNARGKPILNLIISMIRTIVVIPAILFGIKYGISGILVMISIVLVLISGLKIYFISKELNFEIHEIWSNIKDPIYSSLIMSIVVYLAKISFQQFIGMASTLVLCIIIGILTYSIFFYFYSKNSRIEMVNLFKEIIARK